MASLRTTAMRSVAQAARICWQCPPILSAHGRCSGCHQVEAHIGIAPEATVTSRNGPFGVPLLHGNHLLLMYKLLRWSPARRLTGRRCSASRRALTARGAGSAESGGDVLADPVPGGLWG